jgi:hypothetical protein
MQSEKNKRHLPGIGDFISIFLRRGKEDWWVVCQGSAASGKPPILLPLPIPLPLPLMAPSLWMKSDSPSQSWIIEARELSYFGSSLYGLSACLLQLAISRPFKSLSARYSSRIFRKRLVITLVPHMGRILRSQVESRFRTYVADRSFQTEQFSKDGFSSKHGKRESAASP